MSGLFRRLRRPRGATPESADPGAAATDDAPTRELPSGDADAADRAATADTADTAAADTATGEVTGDEPGRADAAEQLDALVGSPPTTRRRGRLRRRLRHVRRVREVLLRDLGGFVFEAHRSAVDAGPVVEAKLQRLATVDTEIRQLEALLDDRRALVVREPGIGGACPNCGELYGSEARYCWACGAEVAAGAGHVPQLPAANTNPQPELQSGQPAAPAAAIEGTAEEAPAGENATEHGQATPSEHGRATPSEGEHATPADDAPAAADADGPTVVSEPGPDAWISREAEAEAGDADPGDHAETGTADPEIWTPQPAADDPQGVREAHADHREGTS